jgi:gamma-glutamylcyclotransferase (GGCT)/AIG2-like uncharacterized protein YtfP
MGEILTTVAVYGTLKKGQGNHGLLSGSKYIGKGETHPNYTLLEMGCFLALSLINLS